ncbi:Glycosyltransferase [Desulfitobacterium sp. LBE]|uniref:Glycosyl transferase group 1 n=2 Tax=root TaxID=1 RepID=B8FX68_DESHD|nr:MULTISPECIES: glycosyltransferase family 4 protein [Desulfitobacterium]ACL18954.1 glycosyl transferase group 1 [Desulfitobacterium hafniense DCB-2]MEA5025059.1 glycosyltransferase family 4 protein [Desulfitobacterium hafniense]TWH58195.1 Glycosyltransferase [Desulfitobacterium sp. LBE]
MKLVIPVLSLETGGTRFIYQIANEMAAKGHHVEIVLPEHAVVAWPLRTQITRVRELTPATIPAGDFILPNFWPTVFPAWGAQKGRVVRLSLGFEPLWVKEKENALATYHIDAPILSISQWHRQIIRQETGRDSTIIPGGVDLSLFHPHPKKSLMANTGPTIAYILRSKEHGYTWKGSDDFWEAIRITAQSFPHFTLQIVAPEGAAYPSPVPYQPIVATTDAELALFYAQADIFVSTSYFEAFAMPPLEAMACGTAVVTTDNGGNRDYAKNGENCLVVPPSDIQQLSQSLLHLLTQAQERQRLAQAGQHTAQAWTWRHSADRLEQFLFQLSRN